jgi:ABC-type multidrug transport system permease subunit
MPQNQFDFLIPIIAIVIPFAFVAVIIGMKYFNERKIRELQHATIRLALEKGQPLPAELLAAPVEAPKGHRATNDRKAGLILIAVGVGLFFFLQSIGTGPRVHLAMVGFIPILIGIALLINARLERREKKDSNG